MRIAARESDLEEQMERATSEAQSSFGDGSVFIEKYVSFAPAILKYRYWPITMAIPFICLSANAAYNGATRKWWKNHHPLF